MPNVIAQMTEEELSEWQDISHEMDAARMHVNDLTFEQAKAKSARETEFMVRLRRKYDIEDYERVAFDETTGVIIEGEE